MIPGQVRQELEDTLIPWMSMRPILCHPPKRKGLRLHEMVVSIPFEQILNETTMHAKATASNHLVKANKSCHGPRVIAKERVRRERENPKGKSKGSKCAKGPYKGKTSKQLVYYVLE